MYLISWVFNVAVCILFLVGNHTVIGEPSDQLRNIVLFSKKKNKNATSLECYVIRGVSGKN